MPTKNERKLHAYGPTYGFCINERRVKPPIDECDIHEWKRRTHTSSYRAKIKRSVQDVNAYLWTARKRATGVSGHQRDACHFLADEIPFVNERRPRGKATVVAAPDVLKDSLRY